jgi:hypothetical protein
MYVYRHLTQLDNLQIASLQLKKIKKSERLHINLTNQTTLLSLTTNTILSQYDMTLAKVTKFDTLFDN